MKSKRLQRIQNHLCIKNTNTLLFLGDTHKPNINQVIPNATIIQCGDFGMGFAGKRYTNAKLKNLNQELKNQESVLIVLRGNHDNPEYFNGDYLYKYSNLHLVPDYTLVTIMNLTDFYRDEEVFSQTILCIGGAISIDRQLRTKGKTYWEDETIDYDPIKLRNIKEYCEENDVKIDTIACHYSPVPGFPFVKGLQFQENDPTLLQESEREMEKMSAIVYYIKDLVPNNLKKVIIGHYHLWKTLKMNGIEYICLDIDQLQIDYEPKFIYDEVHRKDAETPNNAF